MNEQFIQDNFCDAEISQMLKEIGFNEPCLGFYNETGVFCRLKNIQGNEEMALYNSTAPLYQQVFDWLREKHCLHIHVELSNIQGNIRHNAICTSTNKHQSGLPNVNVFNLFDFKTHKEAKLASVSYIINILKQQTANHTW